LRGRLSPALTRGRRRARAELLRVFGLPLAHVVGWTARRFDRRVGIALVYHLVDDPAGDPRRELVPAMGTSLFAAQVHHLRAHYNLIPATELLSATRERRWGERFPVAITFDDDLRSHIDVVAPILGSADATATVFLSGASLHVPYRFWWERLQAGIDRGIDLSPLGLSESRRRDIHELGREIETLSPVDRHEVELQLERLLGPDPPEAGLRSEDVQRLAATGIEIGFHTRRHDPLPPLSDEELARAFEDGRHELEEIVGHRLAIISYPHGRADARVAAAARAAGFMTGFTGTRTVVTADSEPLLLGRFSPSYRSLGELAFNVAWSLLRGSSG
jgi:peptidoglycan/xylan/chitin deacetylase (PgdA/CDA1 family)